MSKTEKSSSTDSLLGSSDSLENPIKAPPTKILILTCSAGNGHLQAARAKVQEFQEKYPDATIIQKDLLIDCVGPTCGNIFAKWWNDAQTSGNTSALEFFTYCQKYADPFIALPIFRAMLYSLVEEGVDMIIDTQPLGTRAIIKAIRYFQWRYEKVISFEKVVTDLPTRKADHFFRPIRKLSLEDRKCMRLLTTEPLLSNGETESAFWEECCNLSKEAVSYTSLPLRKAFHEYVCKPPNTLPLSLEITTSTSQEALLIEKTLSSGSLQTTRSDNIFKLILEPTDKICLLMLGSNPHSEAVLLYVEHFIEEVKKRRYKNRKDHLFIFCSPKNSLLQESILKKIEETPNYPSSLTIAPLPYQEDKVIAPLFHRCNASITRSGGLTSMELLSVSHGQIWIHKGTTAPNLPPFIPFGKIGMPAWERGNADYLEAKRGAQIVTPQTFPTLSSPYFEEL